MYQSKLSLIVAMFLLACLGCLYASPFAPGSSFDSAETLDRPELPFEGFETGNFSAHAWENDSVLPWTIQSSQVYAGTYAAQNGNIPTNYNSSLRITIYVSEPGNISFYYKTSCDPNWDFFEFFIDNVQYFEAQGINDWQQSSFALSAGVHTLRWRYSFGPETEAQDLVWLDNISFPPTAVYYAPPQNLLAEVANLSIGLSWNTPQMGSPQAYKIYRNSEYLGSSTGLSYVDNTCQNDVPYSYYVTAQYPGGESAASNTVTATATAFSMLNLGTGTNSTGSSMGNPVDVSYKSLHGQSVYTAAELQAAGIIGPAKIRSLGFYVTNISGMNMVNYVVRMKHTTASNVSSWIDANDLQTVFSHSGYRPTSIGWNMVTLSSPFMWNGVDNILVDTAFGVNLYPSNSGDVRYTYVTDGYRYIQSNDQDLRNTFSGGITFATRPNLRLRLEPVSVDAYITASTNSFTFGETGVGITDTLPFTIYNSGHNFLTGTITAPAGLYVETSGRDSDDGISQRNVLTIEIPPLHGQSYNLCFAPQSPGNYSGSLQIESNAGNSPTLSLPIIASAYQPPTIVIGEMPSLLQLEANESATHSFSISNTGSQELSYSISLDEVRSNPNSSNIKGRNISGSTLVVDVPTYEPGTTQNLTFTVHNNSNDFEYIKKVQISFLGAVTINSATSFTGGGYGDLYLTGLSGSNPILIWDNNPTEWGAVMENHSASATVNLTIPENYSGPLNLSWQIWGDEWGIEPHTLSGTISLSQYHPPLSWLTAAPVSGLIPAMDNVPIELSFNAVGLEPGLYQADLSIDSNDPNNLSLSYLIQLEVLVELLPPQVNIIRLADRTRLYWELVPGAEEYMVFVSSDPTTGFVVIGVTDTGEFIDQAPLERAFYIVKALRSSY